MSSPITHQLAERVIVARDGHQQLAASKQASYLSAQTRCCVSRMIIISLLDAVITKIAYFLDGFVFYVGQGWVEFYKVDPCLCLCSPVLYSRPKCGNYVNITEIIFHTQLTATYRGLSLASMSLHSNLHPASAAAEVITSNRPTNSQNISSHSLFSPRALHSAVWCPRLPHSLSSSSFITRHRQSAHLSPELCALRTQTQNPQPAGDL